VLTFYSNLQFLRFTFYVIVVVVCDMYKTFPLDYVSVEVLISTDFNIWNCCDVV